MADTVPTGSQQNILNSDGQRHPVENILTIFTLVVGLIAFVLGLIVRNAHTGTAVYITATATGLAALLIGLYAQMISATREQRILIVTGMIAGLATREQRILIVTGMIAGFVGLAIGLSRGGFIG